MLDERQSTDAALDALLSPPRPSRTFYERYRRRNIRPALWFMLSAVILVAVVFLYFAVLRAPRGFATDSYFVVAKGMTLGEAARELDQKNLVQSAFVFKALSVLWGGDTSLKAGEYYFAKPVSVLTLSWRFTHGAYGFTPLKITVPEGLNNREMAALLGEKLSKFNEVRFLKLAERKEGYLFPDTYFFLPFANEDEIITAMEKNFEKQIESLVSEINNFPEPLSKIVIMASLLEEEARTEESRRTIAGILWKRLAQGMPLQVDAVFPYIIGKNTYEITTEDLQVDSPYNTYRYTGLPPGPISNPGIEAIRAAVTPIESPYLYYLSDKEGKMHYARTHDEHVANKEKYLK